MSLFVISSLAAFTPAGADDARVLTKSLTFPEDGGIDNSITETIPQGSTVTTATMTLTGKPHVTQEVATTYDYGSNKGSSDAYDGSSSQSSPNNNNPSTYMGTLFAAGDYTAVSASDNSRKSTYTSYYSYSAYHHYRFKVTDPKASKIEVTWEGYASDIYGTCSAKIYIYNATVKNWGMVGSTQTSTSGDQTITNTFQYEAQDFVDSNNHVHILAMTSQSYYVYLYTDFVKIKYTTGGSKYPKDPTLDVGEDGDMEWQFEGYFKGTKNLNFLDELQEHVDAAGRGLGDVTIAFKFTSATRGILEIHDMTVEYTPPEAPEWSPITDLTLQEDDPGEEGQNFIDLYDYIEDDRPKEELKFAITYEEDNTKVDMALDADGHHLDFTVAENWWGEMGFKVKATDIDKRVVETAEFTVKVQSVNDLPVVDPVPAQNSAAGLPIALTVTASDIDMELDSGESLTFSDNTDMFDIDPVTGEISFTPLKEHIGNHAVTITATDSYNGPGTTIIGFTITAYDGTYNHAPALDPTGDLTADEEVKFEFQVTATDEDLIYGDSLKFSEDCDLFKMNSETGKFSFTPTQQQVGEYNVVITVTDSAGEVDMEEIIFTVNNVNDAPTIEEIPDTKINEGGLFEYTVVAEDVDLEFDESEKLTFSDDSDLFNIDPATGQISYTAGGKDAGDYYVTIKVKDKAGEEAQTTFKLEIMDVNIPPEVEVDVPEENASVKKGEKITATVTDSDGDELTIKWRNQMGDLVAEGPELDTGELDTGKQKVTVEVSDGQATTKKTFDLEVKGDPKDPDKPQNNGGMPGFEGMLLVVALLVGMLVFLNRRRQ